MNYVYLDNKNYEFFVDDDTYSAIVALVQAHKHCLYSFQDRHPYTEDNPCVGKNICLQHLLHKQQALTFAGLYRVDDRNRRVYRFIDPHGVIFTSTEDYSEDAKQSTEETLAYYGFTPPTEVKARGKTVPFYAYYARIHGDLRTASVIVLSYEQYNERVKGLFLLYKHGPTKELVKKSDLYHRADELVEATKDDKGYYHVGSYAHAGKYEADVLDVVSQLESALYDVTVRLQNGRKDTDNRTGESSE